MCRRLVEWLKKAIHKEEEHTPALANTFLFVEPQQHYLEYSTKVLHDLILANKQAGQIITELMGPDANAAKVKQTLMNLNPIVFSGCGHGNYCYAEDTELLTEDGWRRFNELTDEKVATLDESGRLKYEHPTAKFSINYQGRMLHINGKRVDLLVTPNHRMYVAKSTRRGWSKFFINEAQNLKLSHYKFKQSAKWKCSQLSTFAIPAVMKYRGTSEEYETPKDILIEDWVRFFGIWLAEGCTNKSEKSSYRITITQTNDRKRKIMRKWVEPIANALGCAIIDYDSNDHSKAIVLKNKQLFTYLRQFGKAKDKFIPREIKELPPELLTLLLNAMILGDGSRRGNWACLDTASKKLADDAQEICLKTGKSATVHKFSHQELYRVSILDRDAMVGKESIHWEQYDGKIYCVTVPNGLVYVRRNGKPSWSGNSTFTVECTERFMQVGDQNVPLMKDRVVHLNSCQTGSELGPAIMDAGALAYLGSNESFWFYVGDEANTTRAVRSPFLCFAPDTVVAGDFKPISEYAINDHVLGVSGHQQALLTMKRPYKGSMATIKASGMLPITLTPEHRLLVVSGKRSWKDARNGKITFSHPIWKAAKDLQIKHYDTEGDYLLIPKIDGNYHSENIDLLPHAIHTAQGLGALKGRNYPLTFPINEQSAWILGLYVAEGFSHTNGIIFALGTHEKELINALVSTFEKLGYESCISQAVRNTNVIIASILLKRAFRQWCGSGAKNKHIPDFIFYHSNPEILKAFIKGYFEGDGALTTRSTGEYRLVATTISKKLALQLQLLSAKLGALLCLYHGEARAQEMMGRSVKCKERWLLHSNSPALLSIFDCTRTSLNNNSSSRDIGEFLAVPVRDISISEYDGDVYNLETSDHTYLANNLVAHNCEWQFDVSILKGKTVGEARADMLTKYDEELTYWVEGDGKTHADAGELARILSLNKSISTFSGEPGTKPSPVGGYTGAGLGLPPEVVIPAIFAATFTLMWMLVRK